MVAGGGESRPAQATPADRPVFELERFAWAAPDRLEVSGQFAGIEPTPPGEAILVVNGEAGPFRLPAVAGSGSGDDWTASFAWTQVPVAFETAELELGGGLVVELPRPGGRRLVRRQPLRVRRIRAAGALDETAAGDAQADDASGAGTFRARLDQFRAAAEQAAAEGARAADRLDAGLKEAGEAIAARDASIEQLRSELEQSRRDAERLRVELDEQRREAERAGAEIAAARDALEEARANAERLLGRLVQGPQAPRAGG